MPAPSSPSHSALEDSTETPRGTPLERGLVAGFLLAMVLLPAASSVSRRLLGRELPGSAVLAQHITLWVGFIGALLAADGHKHLALTTLDLVPAGAPRCAVAFFGQAVSAFVCALLARASVLLVRAEWASQGIVAFGIRVAWSELVMPVGFAVMAVRFAWASGEGRWRWLERGAALTAALVAYQVPHALGLPGVGRLVLGAVAVAFFLGAPVFVAMSGLAMALFIGDGGPSAIAAVPTATFNLVSSPTLPAIPLLTAAGFVLAEGGAAKRLVRAYKAVFGWLPGGIAIMVTFACAVFTTFTGASGVTILALGGLVLPSLLQEGYPEDFSVGLVTAAGSLGLLFPPSLPVILYAVVAQAPIDHLFIGGFLPGLLMVLLVAGYGVAVGVRARAPRQPLRLREAATAVWDAKWDLGLPAVVIVSVATGFSTVVEAAAIAATYSIAVELWVFRSFRVRDLPRVLVRAATLVGAVVILLGTALGLTSWFVDAEIPTRLVAWMTGHVQSPALFLLMLNAVLLVLGSVLEIYSAIVVLAPLVAPLGRAYGIEPIHLGVVFLANLELGFLFPPMGLNLFLSASRFQKPLPWVYRKTVPFLLIMAGGVLLITYLPAITTGVVRLVAR